TEQYVVEKGKKKKKTVLTDTQIIKIKEIYQAWQSGNGYKDVPELCKSVTFNDVVNQNYSLAPSKYIEFINHDLEIDLDKEMKFIIEKMKEALLEEKKTVSILEEAIKEVNL